MIAMKSHCLLEIMHCCPNLMNYVTGVGRCLMVKSILDITTGTTANLMSVSTEKVDYRTKKMSYSLLFNGALFKLGLRHSSVAKHELQLPVFCLFDG